jgi:hypothetical protein
LFEVWQITVYVYEDMQKDWKRGKCNFQRGKDGETIVFVTTWRPM